MRDRRIRSSVKVLVVAAAHVGFALSAGASAEELVALHGRWMTRTEAAADRTPAPVFAGPNWGTADTSPYTVGSCEAGSRDNTLTYEVIGCGILRPIPGVPSTGVGLPFHLPNGALITSVTMNYYDDLVASDPSVAVYSIGPKGNHYLVTDLSPGDFSAGDNSVTVIVDPPVQVDNTQSYTVEAVFHRSGDNYNGVYNVQFNYRLQVSPAPAVASFSDVPTSHPFFRYVEALAAAGITGGCGTGIYCPDQAVTRGQMAVFLSIALGLHFPH